MTTDHIEPIRDLAQAQEECLRRLTTVIPPRYKTAAVEEPRIQEWVTQYAQEPSEARSLMLWGGTGTGKTWAAYGALKACAVAALKPSRAGVYTLSTWKAVTYPDFLANMRPGTDKEHNPEKYLAELINVPLLMLDDIGTAKNSEFVEQSVYRLISGRYDYMRPSIYTTNLAKNDLHSVLGERIMSRLAEQCLIISMTGEDRRYPQP